MKFKKGDIVWLALPREQVYCHQLQKSITSGWYRLEKQIKDRVYLMGQAYDADNGHELARGANTRYGKYGDARIITPADTEAQQKARLIHDFAKNTVQYYRLTPNADMEKVDAIAKILGWTSTFLGENTVVLNETKPEQSTDDTNTGTNPGES